MNIGVFPFKDNVTVVVSVWMRNKCKRMNYIPVRIGANRINISTCTYTSLLISNKHIFLWMMIEWSPDVSKISRTKNPFPCITSLIPHTTILPSKFSNSCYVFSNRYQKFLPLSRQIVVLPFLEPVFVPLEDSTVIARIMTDRVRYLQLPNFRWQVCLSWGKLRRSITQDAVNDTLEQNKLEHISAQFPLRNASAVEHGFCITSHVSGPGVAIF